MALEPVALASADEMVCDLFFDPPSNIRGKLCYVKGVAFHASPTFAGRQGYHTFQLYADGWPVVQTSDVDWNKNVQHGGTSSANTTTGSKSLTGSSVAFGMAVGASITGTGVPSGTVVESVSGTTVTISKAATAANTATVFTFLNNSDPSQMLAATLVSYNDYGLHEYPTLCQIPDGPHQIRFRVRRSDNGYVVSSVTSMFNFSATFSITPANAKQPPV